MSLIASLLLAHAVCDFPLQGDFLARAKNVTAPMPGVSWWICMGWHVFMHAAAVMLLTHSVVFGAMEFFIHWNTDYLKCRGKIGFGADQGIHVACKIAWAILAWRLAA